MSAFEQSRHLKTPQAPPNHRQHMGCESTFNGGTISTKNAAKSKSQSIFGGPERGNCVHVKLGEHRYVQAYWCFFVSTAKEPRETLLVILSVRGGERTSGVVGKAYQEAQRVSWPAQRRRQPFSRSAVGKLS